jgi:hypothetical protein
VYARVYMHVCMKNIQVKLMLHLFSIFMTEQKINK